MSNFMKICPLEAELFHTDGQTDMAKLMVTFRNFANAPKNVADDFTRSLFVICLNGNTDISYQSENSVCIWTVKRHYLSLKTESLHCFETSGRTCPRTQRHIPQDEF